MGHPALGEADWMAINGMMLLSPWITWQDLTKRPEREAALLKRYSPAECALEAVRLLTRLGLETENIMRMVPDRAFMDYYGQTWEDFAHIHRYVSVSDQETADALIPLLFKMLAAVHGISLEPMTGPVWLGPYMHSLDHVIIGGESGRNARLCAIEWIADVVQQCKRAGVPCFVKQLGSNSYMEKASQWEGQILAFNDSPVITGKGENMSEWPEALRVRQHVGDSL